MKRFFLLLSFSVLFLSCREQVVTQKDQFPPETVAPYLLVEQWCDLQEPIQLLDLSEYYEPLLFLEYLVPLLHKKGYYILDLWFIPQSSVEPINLILNNEEAPRDLFIEELKEISLRTLQERHLLFLLYLQSFNASLEEGESPMVLGEGGDQLNLTLLKESDENIKNLIQLVGPFHFPSEQEQVVQIQSLIQMGWEYHWYDGIIDQNWVIVRDPGLFNISRPLIEEIQKDDLSLILRDFPEITAEKPASWVRYRARGILKKEWRESQKLLNRYN